MALSDCVDRVKEVLTGIDVVDMEVPTEESGVFLLYEGFSRDNGVILRNFGLYINGVSFNGKLGGLAQISQIETALERASEGLSDIGLRNGSIIDFKEDGTYSFRIVLTVQEG